jgi:hypothetical protein
LVFYQCEGSGESWAFSFFALATAAASFGEARAKDRAEGAAARRMPIITEDIFARKRPNLYHQLLNVDCQ